RPPPNPGQCMYVIPPPPRRERRPGPAPRPRTPRPPPPRPRRRSRCRTRRVPRRAEIRRENKLLERTVRPNRLDVGGYPSGETYSMRREPNRRSRKNCRETFVVVEKDSR